MDVTVTANGRVIGHSGSRNDTGEVDPWSYFVNAYVLDKNGNRIDRRNAQDIFVPLYNHQIPPGAASVVHYLLQVPADVRGPSGSRPVLITASSIPPTCAICRVTPLHATTCP